MKQFTVPMNLIKASIHCAGVKDIRYYLNGALFEYSSIDKKLRVISTDGSVLSCFSVYMPECTEQDFSLIIPLATLKLASKVKSNFLSLTQLENGYVLGEFMFIAVVGKFPDYRRVIPDSLSGEAANYQPELVLAAQNAIRDYYESKKTTFTMVQNGINGPAVIHNGFNDALVVVMPVRVTEKDGSFKTYANFN